METLTRQQSLKAFLPSRVAALPHVVDMIDAFAMRLDEAALQAARRKNWERAGALISDMQCDILNLAGAAKDEEAETLRTIGSYISQQRLFLAVAESDDLEAAKVLYTWSNESRHRLDSFRICYRVRQRMGGLKCWNLPSRKQWSAFHPSWLSKEADTTVFPR